MKVIEKEIETFLEEKRKNSRPEIKIDVAKLQNIRLDSIKTREKLIVDEEYDIPEKEPEKAEAEPKNETALSDAEYKIMRCLLYGGDFAAAAREGRVLLSVAIDSINQKLFDALGDTAVVFEGDRPEVLEDYADELRSMVKQ